MLVAVASIYWETEQWGAVGALLVGAADTANIHTYTHTYTRDTNSADGDGVNLLGEGAVGRR